MKGLVFAATTAMLAAPGAFAQTAEFKCPALGTVVQYSEGSKAKWLEQVSNYCILEGTSRDGATSRSRWYAPTATVSESRLFWSEQTKPWMIWPLQVGKKHSARYDGAGSTASEQGSWNFTFTVVKFERVTTKAGTFDAFHVLREQDSLSGTYKEKWSQWYAPEPGVTVKFDYWNSTGRASNGEVISIGK